MRSRRDVLKQIAAAALVGPASARRAQSQADAAIRIGAQRVEIRITPISRAATRVTFIPLAGAPQIPNDGSLVARDWPAAVARVETASHAPVTSGDLLFRFSAASPGACAVRIEAKDGRLVQQLSNDPDTGALAFGLGDGPLLGFGEGGPQFDRRGATDRMRSGQDGYRLRTHGGRVPIPWLVSADGWALFIHHPFGTFDLSGVAGRFEPLSPDTALPLDVFVIGTRDPQQIMKEYAGLTGFPAMPPRWAFGYQQSHRTLAEPSEILDEARAFRDKKLPCDTLIYLGTGFCPSGWNTDNGEFTFNRNVFPDPAGMIRQLHDDHFKVVLHIVLEGRTLRGSVDDTCTAAPLPSGRSADGRWPDDRQASCYWPAHKPLADAGVDGWWPDQGDGLDAASRLARNRMYWEGPRQWRPDERPFALHRNGYAGMQRYGAFLWSGDVYSTWETLATHVPVAINTGLSGIPFWGTDIGGFVPTKELTGELYVRWFQFSAFCPLFRAHGRTWKLRLPWGWNTGELGPDEISTSTGGAANPDPSELHNAAVEPICRKYLELRYRLLPYLYSAVRAAHETGLPIMRALWLHYPDDPIAAARGDEYLWGRDLLVAPVVEKNATVRRVYLPRGAWHDFWTETVHDGGRELARPVDLETMPLFVRGGAVLPLGPVIQYTGERVDEPLTVQVYPGADGAALLYEDDGASFGFERGDWAKIEIRWTDRSQRLAIRSAGGMRPKAPRRLRLRAAGSGRTREVTFSGSPLEVQL